MKVSPLSQASWPFKVDSWYAICNSSEQNSLPTSKAKRSYQIKLQFWDSASKDVNFVRTLSTSLAFLQPSYSHSIVISSERANFLSPWFPLQMSSALYFSLSLLGSFWPFPSFAYLLMMFFLFQLWVCLFPTIGS